MEHSFAECWKCDLIEREKKKNPLGIVVCAETLNCVGELVYIADIKE